MNVRTERTGRALAIGIQLLSTVVMLAGVGLTIGYYDYLLDEGRERACDQQFGPESEWVGNLNDFPGSGIICETPSGTLKSVEETSALPVSPQTFSSFLGELGGNYD